LKLNVRIIIGALVLLVITGALAPQASAKTPDVRAYDGVHLLGVPPITTVKCVSDRALEEDKLVRVGSRVYGDYDGFGDIRLSYSRICKPFATYRVTGTLTGPALDAMLTIAHEAAHAKGTRYEATAECRGVRGALSLLQRYRASA
jgi:hypothetical protein